MSEYAEQRAALNELEKVLTALKEELAGWRRRALKAEASGKGGGGRAGSGNGKSDGVSEQLLERVEELETENSDLLQRLETARGRVDGLLDRLQFLEEQTGVEAG
ncbi:MAG: hypothetical protein ACE5FJ_03970 [Gemmatimonadales bacterium]